MSENIQKEVDHKDNSFNFFHHEITIEPENYNFKSPELKKKSILSIIFSQKRKIGYSLIGLLVFMGAYQNFTNGAEKALNLQNQKIELAQKISEKEIKNILAQIDKSQEKNIESLQKLYWSAKYVIEVEKEAPYSLSEVHNRIRKLAQENIRFHQNRKQEINKAYKLVNTKNFNLMDRMTYDGKDTFDTLLNWENITQTNTINIDRNIIVTNDYWLRNVKNPENLQKYLEDNQKQIKKLNLWSDMR